MVHYSLDPENPKKHVNFQVHFKNTCKTAQAIKGLYIQKATKYLKDVGLRKQCVPFWQYNGEVSKSGQVKQWGWTQVSSQKKKNLLNFTARA